jgi:acetylornithine deacetylase/succinyl-diaminopimelate desuccinylase-like protein
MLTSAQLDRLRAHVEAHREDALARLFALLRLPTVAHPTDHNPALDTCANLLVDHLKRLGSRDARVVGGYLHPLVTGAVGDDPRKPTMLIYGHFDVQEPGPPELWETPAFEPSLRDGKIFARGAGDNKGQFFTHFLAIEALRACGIELPINVKFILDGGEEIGSVALAQFVRDQGEALHADLVYEADGPVHESGRPTLVLGCRGIVYLRVRVRTLRRSAHSAYAPVLPSAAWRAVEILSSLRDARGHVMVEGFYDEVAPPTAADLGMLRTIPPVDAELVAEFEPRPRPAYTADEYYGRLMLEPVVNIAGLATGDLIGNQTTLPGDALIKIEFGLVPHQRSSDIVEKVAKHLVAHGVDAEDVEVVFTTEPSRTPAGHPLVQPIADAIGAGWGEPVVVMNSFSSYAPFYLFTDRLGMKGFYACYGQPDESNHAPNERLALANFFKGIVASASVFAAVGRQGYGLR